MKAKKVLIALVFILLFAVLVIYIVSTSGGQNTSGRVDVRLNEIMLSNKGAPIKMANSTIILSYITVPTGTLIFQATD